MTKEIKTTCAPKCYKLDRRRNLCERHQQPVERTGPNSYLKCQACVEATTNGNRKV